MDLLVAFPNQFFFLELIKVLSVTRKRILLESSPIDIRQPGCKETNQTLCLLQYTARFSPATTPSTMHTESLPDYLTIPGKTIPSFHCRVGRKHNDRQPLPVNTYGYPVPGVQEPTPTSVMARDYIARYEAIPLRSCTINQH